MRSNDARGRRAFLAGLARSVAATAVLGISVRGAAAMPAVRTLSIRALHTDEELTATFFRDGRYDSGALDAFDYLLRDWRADSVHAIDPALLDTLSLLHRSLDGREPFHLISGYRSPETNAALAANGGGVARRSLHMEGKAADIRLPGRSLGELHQAAVALEAGGVGLYTRSDFVHVDTGRVRYWGS